MKRPPVVCFWFPNASIRQDLLAVFGLDWVRNQLPPFERMKFLKFCQALKCPVFGRFCIQTGLISQKMAQKRSEAHPLHLPRWDWAGYI